MFFILLLLNANGKLLTKTFFLSLRFSTTEEKGLEKKEKKLSLL